MGIDETARLENSTVGDAEIREYVTVHDSDVDDGVRIYERTSVKKSDIAGPTDVNANAYVENARLEPEVQVGPNAAVVGVTHDIDEAGMEFRNDVFDEVVLEAGAFVGAGAVVLPGVTVGEDAVVGAGVTVEENVPAGTVVRGGRRDDGA
ncbi:acyltransferase [Natronomonas marina]|jgi:acetyltransferase-like isoleucine patch superfamily enzyme|uniref:acyltransferase n=1 Tax=Natronomonas marina TaxID=2961939 RepID=UPI0020C986AC|nr:DapH/DapD/GlmU-related protein [Natronomonas marina]